MSKIPEVRGQYDIVRQDELARHLIEINSEHARIHQGNNFSISDVDTDVDIITPKQYLFITPNTATRIHFTFSLESEPGCTVEFFEDTTVTGNGTALSIINSRRDIANTSEMLAYYDPTVTVDGTRLFIQQSGTSTSGGKVGGHVSHEDEFILDVNSKYQIKITSLADNTKVSIYCDWYELR